MRLWFTRGGERIDTVEHEQWRLRQVDVPTKPQRKAPLVFFLLFVAVLAIASTAAVMADVKTDGYSHHAHLQTVRFS
jgi:hypothetical protein